MTLLEEQVMPSAYIMRHPQTGNVEVKKANKY